MSTPTPRLRVEHVSKRFGAVRALDDVSFELQPGEIHALVGENGAGKSTLVSIITGIRNADSGTVELDGRPVRFKSPIEARAAGIAAVYQDPHLFPHLTVAENVLMGQLPRRGPFVDHRAMNARAEELLGQLGYSTDVEQTVAGLTVAEAQFVEIARAISSDLGVLILDEPTSALTPNESERLYDVVHRLQEQGTTIVWISHRMEEVRALADTMTVLRDGTHVRTAPSDDLDDDELIRLMVGRSVTIERVERTQEPGDVCLEVRDLSVPGKFADVDFEVREGEIVTLAGLVGAGRSEIAQAIFGLDPLVTGTVFVEGEPVKPTSPRVMSDHGVAYLPEDRDAEGVITTLPIADNIALPSTVDLAWHGVMRRDQELELADEQRAALSIKGENDDPVNSLSGGNRQKVALARWLATKPKVLMLDEPTHGIDVGTKAQVHRIMRELAREERLGILMISSDMPEVLAVSDRILVIARGRLVAELDAGTATQEQVLAAATNTQAVAS